MNQILTTSYLLILISLGYFATDVYLPSLPAIAKYFQASDQDVQNSLVFYLLSFGVAPMLFGPLSDHIGRKKVLLFGVFIALGATLGCLFASSIESFIAFRVFQGFGCGAVLISARASASDLFEGKQFAQQLSLITMFMPLVLALAPTLGGFLQEKFQWQAVFVFLIGYMLLILTCISLRSESLKEPKQMSILSTVDVYRNLIRHRLFVLYGLNFVLPTIGLFAYMTLSPFLFQNVIGLSPSEYGSLSLYIGGTIMATAYLNRKLIAHYELETILAIGASLLAIAGLLLLVFHMMGILTTWSLLLPTLLYFTCLSFCVGNSASKSMSYLRTHFGSAAALMTTVQFLAGSLGSFLFSITTDKTALPLALCFLIIGILSLMTLRLSSKLESINQPMITS